MSVQCSAVTSLCTHLVSIKKVALVGRS